MNNRISEFALIDTIIKKLPKYNKQIVKGIGDDAAVVMKNKKNTFFIPVILR